MTYRDNEVSIKLSHFYGYTLVKGSYTIDSYSVTSGQDPDVNIHAGLVVPFGGDGKMSFKVGRKGSDDTATWFNEKVSTSQTTFGHTADKLNFAFMGTLELTLTGDIYGTDQVTFTFSNVVLAQGHTGGSNNWWFGGTNCTNIGNDTVACVGASSNDTVATFNYLRGFSGDRGPTSASTISLIPADMVYQDNEVSITSSSSDYSLVGGSYTVESHSITSGQDPNGNIHDGMVKSFNSDGKMSFPIGRKGSDDTAKWFNGKVSASQTTFDHTAGNLNFAFMGTLVLTLTGDTYGTDQVTFTFLNVALAQGRSGARNNWWFGGNSCSYIQDHKVSCEGVFSSGALASFNFLRGGNGVNTIEFTPTTLIDTENWMQRLNTSTKLNQIMMPGSHDAGMSETQHCAPRFGAGRLTQTQSGSVGQQLLDGSRYFDIRIDYDQDELVTYHRTEDGWGCNGQSLKSVLDQTKAFLSAHSSEIAILKFSHIRAESVVTKQKIDDLLNSYTASIYVNLTTRIDLGSVTLNDVNGKMILVFDYNQHIDPSKGRFRYRDGSSVVSGSNLTVYDKYSNTSDYETMKSDQVQKWDSKSGLGQAYLFLLSWTLTPTFWNSVATLAQTANADLPNMLHAQIITNGKPKPNVVYIDYMNNVTAQSIIQYNF